jgi:signal transduction histidine kinase
LERRGAARVVAIMALFSAFSRRLYLRIWLAVVFGVAVLTTAVGWAWRIAAEHSMPTLPPREVMVRNMAGELLGSAQTPPGRMMGQPTEFTVTLNDGQTLQIVMPSRRRGPPSSPPPPWMRPPFGFVWMLALVGLAVALGVYPIVRRLTQRLETLQRGVQRWGDGDLSVRIPVRGQDEVADLSQRFNAAAERIESLMASQQALLASQKSLLANASHELRSPLARIRMGLELMGGPSAPGSATPNAFREEISRNIAELDQLIDEILLASRLDAREADMGTVEPVDLTGLAAEECARGNAELDAGGDSVVVQGVAKLLRRVLRNLLENARRYSTGEIRVSVAIQGDRAVLKVSDKGPGIPADQRERIFEPFYRLPGASERNGGVGLGLSLVKSIVTRHFGEVRCEETPGGGATFVVILPKIDV